MAAGRKRSTTRKSTKAASAPAPAKEVSAPEEGESAASRTVIREGGRTVGAGRVIKILK